MSSLKVKSFLHLIGKRKLERIKVQEKFTGKNSSFLKWRGLCGEAACRSPE
jgi:hypothetical protein